LHGYLVMLKILVCRLWCSKEPKLSQMTLTLVMVIQGMTFLVQS